MPVAFDRAAHLRRIGFKNGNTAGLGVRKKDIDKIIDAKQASS
jgi:hypothetical protein